MRKIILVTVMLTAVYCSSFAAPKRIGFINFEGSGVEKGDLSAISDWFKSVFVNAAPRDYRPIDRAEMEAVFSEFKLSMSNISSEESMLEVGRMLSAQYLVHGKIVSSGWLGINVGAKVLNVETGESVPVEPQPFNEGDGESLENALIKLAESITESMKNEQQLLEPIRRAREGLGYEGFNFSGRNSQVRLAETFTLPKLNTKDVSLKWHSSDSGRLLIRSDGKAAVYPPDEGFEIVTLSAVMESGGKRLLKEFDFCVSGEEISATDEFFFQEKDGGLAVLYFKDRVKNVFIPPIYKGKRIVEIISSSFSNSSLESLVIPTGVTNVGDYAFNRCFSLRSVSIPDSVTSIGDRAFYWCNSFTSVSIPDSVTSIGEWAFYNCESLSSVSIGNSVTSIGSNAFNRCYSLSSVSIGNSVRSIGEDAFAWCESLTSVTIPDSVRSIGEDAFSYCESLTSVTIPDSVTSIGSSAFAGCDSLTSVSIGNGVRSIGEYAFAGCDSLTSVSIPDSVRSIGEEAFAWCESLTSVTIEARTPPSLGLYVFYNNASGRKFYVPAGSVTTYKNDSDWGEYAENIMSIEEGGKR